MEKRIAGKGNEKSKSHDKIKIKYQNRKNHNKQKKVKKKAHDKIAREKVMRIHCDKGDYQTLL